MCQAHTVCKMLVLFDFEYCQGGMEDKKLGCCLFGAILWDNLCTIDCRQRFDMFPWGNSSILRQWRTGDCTYQPGRHHLFWGVGRRDLKIRKKFINKIHGTTTMHRMAQYVQRVRFSFPNLPLEHGAQEDNPSTGAIVLFLHSVQDFSMLWSRVVLPRLQTAQVSFVELFQYLPGMQQNDRPGLPSKSFLTILEPNHMVLHHVLLNLLAFLNMFCISAEVDNSHFETSELNATALSNIDTIDVTFAVFHLDRSELNVDAPQNTVGVVNTVVGPTKISENRSKKKCW
jgi:hypothetical protein